MALEPEYGETLDTEEERDALTDVARVLDGDLATSDLLTDRR